MRQARPEDAMEILRWRNDPETRSMSRRSAVIDEKQHNTWFSMLLKDPWRILLVGTCQNRMVGMVRFDRNHGKVWETNIVMAPESRGKGLGTVFLDMALKHFFSIHPKASLLAEVKKCNTVSRRLFSSLGFVCCEDAGELLHFQLAPQEPWSP
jgi:RimJ/RimL family protein N-acetyltransferase